MTCIVHSQAFLQIMRRACVVMYSGSNITQNVDVVEMSLAWRRLYFWVTPEKR